MAKEIKTGEIVALKKIRMDNEREGVSYIWTTSTSFDKLQTFVSFVWLIFPFSLFAWSFR